MPIYKYAAKMASFEPPGDSRAWIVFFEAFNAADALVQLSIRYGLEKVAPPDLTGYPHYAYQAADGGWVRLEDLSPVREARTEGMVESAPPPITAAEGA